MILRAQRQRKSEGISRLANPIGFHGSIFSRAHHFGLKARPSVVLPALGKEVVTIVMKTARDRAGDLDVPFWKLMPLLEELHRHLWKPCQLLWKNVQNMAGKCAVNHLFTFISKILTLEIPESSPDRMALEKASFQDGADG